MSMFNGDCKTCSEPSDSDWCFNYQKKLSKETKNNEEQFKKEYLSIWEEPSKQYEVAYKLWIYYQYQCEMYDRKICTGTIKFDGIMPSNAWEYAQIRQYSYHQMQYILSEAKRFDIDNKDWNEVKQDVNRLTWKGIQEEYQRLYADKN